MIMKNLINFQKYKPVDKLDAEEQTLWKSLQDGDYTSIIIDELKTDYADIFKHAAKRDQASSI